MYYLSVPLKPVDVPKVANRWGHTLGLVGAWIGFNVVIDAVLLAVADMVGFGMPTPGKQHLLEFYVVAIIAALTLVFMYVHHVEARSKHWREVAYPVYNQHLAEVKAWTWQVLGATHVDDQWVIACVRHSRSEGQKGHTLTVPAKFVTKVAGGSDSLEFDDIRKSVSRRPGHDNQILIGGQVILIFDWERGDVLPLPSEFFQNT